MLVLVCCHEYDADVTSSRQSFALISIQSSDIFAVLCHFFLCNFEAFQFSSLIEKPDLICIMFRDDYYSINSFAIPTGTLIFKKRNKIINLIFRQKLRNLFLPKRISSYGDIMSTFTKIRGFLFQGIPNFLKGKQAPNFRR